MKTKHTPGPWEVISGSVWSQFAGQIAKMDRDNPKTMPTERDANACLIAAAPEMLKHLLDCVEWMELHGQKDIWPENLVLKSARTAIAKAEGKED